MPTRHDSLKAAAVIAAVAHPFSRTRVGSAALPLTEQDKPK